MYRRIPNLEQTSVSMLLCSGYLVEVWRVERTEIPIYGENSSKSLG